MDSAPELSRYPTTHMQALITNISTDNKGGAAGSGSISTTGGGGNGILTLNGATGSQLGGSSRQGGGVAFGGQQPVVCYPAGPDGKARVPLPGNVLMEVAVGNTYVMNPLDSTTYYVQWGRVQGADAVLSCSPVPVLQPGTPSATSGSAVPPAQLPVAMPVGGGAEGYGPGAGSGHFGSSAHVGGDTLYGRGQV